MARKKSGDDSPTPTRRSALKAIGGAGAAAISIPAAAAAQSDSDAESNGQRSVTEDDMAALRREVRSEAVASPAASREFEGTISVGGVEIGVFGTISDCYAQIGFTAFGQTITRTLTCSSASTTVSLNGGAASVEISATADFSSRTITVEAEACTFWSCSSTSATFP